MPFFLIVVLYIPIGIEGDVKKKIDFIVLQERQRVVYEEQKKLAQNQAQIKSQMARYEDELARKRMQVCDVACIFNLQYFWL